MEPQELENFLRQHFAGAEPQLEIYPSGRIGGFLIWNGFEDQEQIERQNTLWALLQRHLTPMQQQAISTVLTTTPEEWEVLQSPLMRDLNAV